MSKQMLRCVILVGSISLMFGACSSGDEDDTGGGGQVAAGGTGGTDNTGGTGGTDNTGGTGGTDNTGGTGGTDNTGGTGGTDNTGGTGGTDNTGGTGGGDPNDPWASMGCFPVAQEFERCGGDLVGTWDLVDSCLRNKIGEDLADSCPAFSAEVTLSYTQGYTLIFDEQEVTLPSTTRTLGMNASIPFSCVPLIEPENIEDIEQCSDLSGPESGTCTGDETCTCVLALVDELNAGSQGYTSSENGRLNLDQDGGYDYCVQGDSLYVLGRGFGEGGDSDTFLYRFTRR